MPIVVRVCCPILLWSLLAASLAIASSPAELTYEADVRPLLKTHCFHCHGEADRREGSLDLRLRRLVIAGGDSGPGIIPGDPDGSVLLARLEAGEMPPEDIEHRPTAEEIETIRRWIALGAVTELDEPEGIDPDAYFTPQERNFWSFQPVRRPQLPQPKDASRVRTPIDQFIATRLEEAGLGFSPDASRRDWLRRAHYDLLGLPPSPEAMQAFLQDTAAGAYERMIDRLLASPHYGERWGRHWLDAAGYADSEGYTETDPVRPDAYKYRDYVIRSFNQDKPLDRFVVEQLAGDELIGRPLKNLSHDEQQWLVATGFLRMAPDGTASGGVDATVARNEVIAKTVEVVSSSLLGLTVACAQCHDHRYDPITHVDYYSFRAIFDPAFNWKQWKTPSQRKISLYTDADRQQATEIEQQAKQVEAERTKLQQELIEATVQRELAKLPEDVRPQVAAALDKPPKERSAEQQALLKQYPSVNVTAGSLYLYDRKAADRLKAMAEEAAAIRRQKPPEEFVRALWEPAQQPPPPSNLFARGDPEQPQQPVVPRELSILGGGDLDLIPGDDPQLPTTGRRLAYARWLTSGRHPLLARVLANRIWQQHFGRGLVTTPGDFGFLGERPEHPELLDWLADELVASGWSTKHLHRLIMTSTVYRQSSARHAEGEARDVENRLYWHKPLQRIEAEVLRDAMLVVSGQLNGKAYGPAVPVMADRVGQYVIGIENLNAGRPGQELPLHGEDLRRSIYVQVRRSRPLSMLEPFDLPALEPNCTARSASTVPTQSLLLMNSPVVLERAAAFAERVRREAGDSLEAQVQRAWQLAFAETPTPEDTAAAVNFLAAQREHFASLPPEGGKNAPKQDPQLEALASFCHALFSSNAFLYID